MQIRDFSERSRRGVFSAYLLLTTLQVTRPQSLKGVPPARVTRTIGEPPCDTRRCGDKSRRAPSRSRCQAARAKEVRSCLAPIGFPRMVYEVTTGPRLASPVSTVAVETCHPHVGEYPYEVVAAQDRPQERHIARRLYQNAPATSDIPDPGAGQPAPSSRAELNHRTDRNQSSPNSQSATTCSWCSYG